MRGDRFGAEMPTVLYLLSFAAIAGLEMPRECHSSSRSILPSLVRSDLPRYPAIRPFRPRYHYTSSGNLSLSTQRLSFQLTSSTMAFIRPYKASDFDATGHICRATLPPSLERSEAATRTAPYLWTHQYTHLSPETCHILDDGEGNCVGYCIGCPNVNDFASAYPRYIKEVLETSKELDGRKPKSLETKAPWNFPDTGEVNEEALLQQAFNPTWLVLDDERKELWGNWKATMHIDLLEPWQGKGLGRKLIDKFVESLKEADQRNGGSSGNRLYGKGVHIGVGGENDKVVPFYEKLGFRVYPTDEKGSIWMVKDVE
ncbi:acetyltransferase [Colletotrichum lupini]|uniref:Acetyltransferase n=1 Tax=Colletotrichum lupini TaxID=145971 RepID=A0A9Q8WQL0_9PEZI|nr:acetyltransferase [Colletotrichum lupini]UQC91537.1 acetyltransferase [Colletotrichum lupini]